MKMTARFQRRAIGAQVGMVLAIVCGTQVVSAAGRCISVEVDQSMAFPDGTRRPAGHLKLCPSRAGSPVQVLHEIFVDGEAVGRLPSRRGLAEAATGPYPMVTFQKLVDGSLVLVGYSMPDPRGSQTYRLVPPNRRSARPRPLPIEPTADLVLAARLN